jgi:HD-GYP domain-containing protein (c-di-GMP phosphodiesterase class II)
MADSPDRINARPLPPLGRVAPANRLGLGEQVAEALACAFARWDAKGLPAGVGNRDIPLPARLLHLADVVVAHHRLGGVERAVTVARARRGTQFDPELVDTFCLVAPGLFVELDELSGWDEVISAEPALGRTLDPERIDSSLEVLADFADLKSPFFLGHSRGVAELVASAAEGAGHSQVDVVLSRRAALVHDIGRAGVPNTIWDKPAPLTSAELERVRLHDYYTERMLRRPAALAEIGAVASAGHERVDGSGYHRGTSGSSISASRSSSRRQTRTTRCARTGPIDQPWPRARPPISSGPRCDAVGWTAPRWTPSWRPPVIVGASGRLDRRG